MAKVVNTGVCIVGSWQHAPCSSVPAAVRLPLARKRDFDLATSLQSTNRSPQASAAVSRSLAEIDLAAKRHAVAGRKGRGVGDGGLLGDGRDDAEDVTDHAEKQVNRNMPSPSSVLTLVQSIFSERNRSQKSFY